MGSQRVCAGIVGYYKAMGRDLGGKDHVLRGDGGKAESSLNS